MTNEPSSLKKAAVLTGLTMVMGGAEVSGAGAATLTTTPQPLTFSLDVSSNSTASQTLNFNKFNSSLGTLTSVDFSLDSNFLGSAGQSLSATIQFPSGNPLNSFTPTIPFTTGPTAVTYDPSFTGLVGTANTGSYTGTGMFGVIVTLNCGGECNMAWDGGNATNSTETGLTLTYDYSTAATPLPASLPLLATGLGGLGLAAWRSRRKQKPASQG